MIVLHSFLYNVSNLFFKNFKLHLKTRTIKNPEMKKLIICLLVFITGTGISIAQLTKVGGALSYNTGYYFNQEEYKDHKTGNPVLSATGIYEISLPIHLKPSINVYIPRINKYEDYGTEKRIVSAFSLDVDAHYVFNYLDRFELYGLAGLNVLYVRMKYKYEYEEFSEVSSSGNNALGLNLGAGTYIKLKDELDMFVELKAILGKQIQGVLTAGVLLNVDWMSKHENTEL